MREQEVAESVALGLREIAVGARHIRRNRALHASVDRLDLGGILRVNGIMVGRRNCG